MKRRQTLPCIALLAVYDDQDRPISVGCGDPGLRRALMPLWEERPLASGTFRPDRPTGHPTPFSYSSRRVTVDAAAPTCLGLLVVRAPREGVFGPASLGAWRFFYLPVLGLAAGALPICLLLADRAALRPLIRFVSVARAARRSRRGAAPPRQPETMNRLIDEIEQLRVESEHWRQEAQHLNRSVDRRVDSMTRHITRELRNAFKQAATDPLTGLGNRRALDENLGQLIEQSIDAGADLSLVMIDLDGFKTLNDTYGHQAGDHTLRFLGGMLAGSCREDDIAVRLGGDEFVLLLPGVRSKDAERIAERLNALFRQRCSDYKLGSPLTISAGIVSLRDCPTRNAQEFLRCADTALYAVKQAGRNGVEIYVPGRFAEKPVA
jgi:diguanylate cyclase (GGDEF)-like protein